MSRQSSTLVDASPTFRRHLVDIRRRFAETHLTFSRRHSFDITCRFNLLFQRRRRARASPRRRRLEGLLGDPRSPKHGPSSSKFETQIWPEGSNIGRSSTKLGLVPDRDQPDPAKAGPESTEISPTSTKLGPNSAKFGPGSSNAGPDWAIC